MVYTVTLNPSLDYVVSLPALKLGQVNRTEKEAIFPGGKGINVSLVLQHLGVASTVFGFTAGAVGTQLEQLLAAHGCRTDFIRLPQGETRINVKIKAEQETEINAQGPFITPYALEQLYRQLDTLSAGDFLVLAGSIPACLSPNMYADILNRLKEKKIEAVVDATGSLLKCVLPCRPFLIKPNSDELAALFGQERCTEEAEIIRYAKELQQLGARNVLVSRAGDGAVLVCEDGQCLVSAPPKGTVVNSVGAGDSMVAGFLAGYLEHHDFTQAFRLGLCAGSASAFQEWLADKEQIIRLLSQM